MTCNNLHLPSLEQGGGPGRYPVAKGLGYSRALWAHQLTQQVQSSQPRVCLLSATAPAVPHGSTLQLPGAEQGKSKTRHRGVHTFGNDLFPFFNK